MIKDSYNIFSNSFNNMSIKKKFSILIIIATFIPISIMAVSSYTISKNLLEENTIKSTTALIELTSNKLAASLSAIDEISLMISFNSEIQQILNTDQTTVENLRMVDKVNSLFNEYISTNSKIDSIALYNKNNSLFLYNITYEKTIDKQDLSNFATSGLYDEVVSAMGKSYWIRLNRDKNKISLVRAINILGTHDKIGVLVINIAPSMFDDLDNTLNIYGKGGFFIKDGNNKLAFYNENHRDSGLLQHSLGNTYKKADKFVSVNKDEYILISDILKYPKWTINVYLPVNEVFSAGRAIKNLMYIALIICVLIIAFIVVMISDYITKPLTKLRELMAEVEKGNLSVKFKANYNDEIGYLCNSFDNMVRKIKQYIELTFENNQKLRKRELEALQMQINPHFLYNTLDTINWMAQDIHEEKIAVISRSLANYFRLCLSKGKQIISIEDELNQVKSYLDIQKIRYQDLIKIEFDIDEKINKFKIIKLTLQPIIENAIYHGIKKKKGMDGLIKIFGRIVGDNIEFQISDNGAGINALRLNEIREGMNNDSTQGYGMRNVNERIKLHFGDNYGLEIDSEYHKWTTVKIIIPLIREERQNESSIS
jgi:two-component system sensor histidine kinase YesM